MSKQFKGWKKIADHKDHAVMQHADGHEIRVAKSALSPKLRGQLAEIPVHTEGAEDNKAGAKAVNDNKGQMKLAAGGKVSMAEQRQSMVDAANGTPKKGPSTPQPYEDKPTKLSPTASKGETAAPASDPEARRAKEDSESTPVDFRKMADGGEVTPTDVPSPDELIPGVPQAASDPQAFDFEQKKSAIAQSMQGARPDPQSMDMAVTSKALDQVEGEKAAGAQAAAATGADQGAAYQQAIDLNKRLVAAGQKPMPLPPAPAGGSPDPSAGMPDAQAGAQQGMAGGQPQGNSDPFGTGATMDMFNKGLGMQQQGIAGEARALGAQGDAEAKVAHDNAVTKQSLMDDYKNQNDLITKHRQEFMDAVQNEKIDPNHYLGSMNTGERISTAIGLILGGMGAGLTGGENPAMKMLNMQIDRDIDAQKQNLGTKKSLLEYNMQQAGNLRDATTMTKIMMNDIAADKFKEAAAKAMSPLAKSRALQAQGQLLHANAAMAGQNAMRQAMLNGAKNGKVSPSSIVEMAIPAESRPAARKELKEMQDAVQLRDHVLSAFDQIGKINTIGNRITSPIQSTRQLDAIMGPVLDKVTKDTSGRVTPETVSLIKSAFGRMGNSPETQMKARQSIDALVSQGMNYPTLKAFGITPESMGRFGQSGQPRIQGAAPVPNKKR